MMIDAAVVTGASSGIGRAVAVALGPHAKQLVLIGRDPARLADAAAATHNGAATVLTTDLADPDAVPVLGHHLADLLGGVDVLVHSAGDYASGEVPDTDAATFDHLYAVNVRAPYELTRELLPHLRARHGDVIFMNSTQGLAAYPGVSQYAATKHALTAVADSLRGEVNAAGVRVTTLHLGRTATPMQERIHAAAHRPYRAADLVQPQDVADVVLSVLALPRRTQVNSVTIWPTHP
ncbi:short-chain dehydrogenase/reductase SDR [Pseudonocardia dioxanivorans CB1190]|uniref:Short-chain dehydrogenase/reductase SDR n=1 Tax=Pseudonocardia dioxanivorans (strain ATCC 55486 / DSM 44775 / JCM 13855 / CB1190) TaxID=675635 RepID=F4CJ99_PSEUX|nr:SDR family NAD(P)-dependent oxidoreductase [Pseudonocardia dioxanivorans]AEA24338.1 short-chain dehydrogenase/reductase SDR [Pseudonocardia dioxanivorans CB1190]